MADTQWGIKSVLPGHGPTVTGALFNGGGTGLLGIPATGKYLKGVSIRLFSTATNVRAAVYQGGSVTNPDNSNLLKDLDQIVGPLSDQWYHWTLAPGNQPAFPPHIYWIVFKTNGAIDIYETQNTGLIEDFPSANGVWLNGGMSADPNAVWEATAPVGAVEPVPRRWYNCYLTYGDYEAPIPPGPSGGTGPMMNTFVSELQTFLEADLEDYINLYTTNTYKLSMVTFYDFEKNTFEQLPAGLILPEAMDVEAREVKSEIYNATIMLYLVEKGTKNRLPRRMYLYEKAIRECVFANRNYNNNYYWIDNVTYGLQRQSGSVLIKDLILTVKARGQYNFE